MSHPWTNFRKKRQIGIPNPPLQAPNTTPEKSPLANRLTTWEARSDSKPKVMHPTVPPPLRLLHAPLRKEDRPTENRPHSSCIQHKRTSPSMHSTRTFWKQALFQALCKVLGIQRWWDAVLLSGCASGEGGGGRNTSTANYQRWREKKPHRAEKGHSGRKLILPGALAAFRARQALQWSLKWG